VRHKLANADQSLSSLSLHCFFLIATNKKLRMLCFSLAKSEHSHRKTSISIKIVHHSNSFMRPYETDIKHNYLFFLPSPLPGKNCKELKRKNLNAQLPESKEG